MSSVSPEIIWPDGFDDRGSFEMPMRGYLSHVFVQAGDVCYPVYFIDPVHHLR